MRLSRSRRSSRGRGRRGSKSRSSGVSCSVLADEKRGQHVANGRGVPDRWHCVEDVRELARLQIDDERLALYRHAAPRRCRVPHLDNAQSAYVSIRQRTSANVRIRRYLMRGHKAPLCVGGEAEELQVVA